MNEADPHPAGIQMSKASQELSEEQKGLDDSSPFRLMPRNGRHDAGEIGCSGECLTTPYGSDAKLQIVA
jgi:hypothetical protein